MVLSGGAFNISPVPPAVIGTIRIGHNSDILPGKDPCRIDKASFVVNQVKA